MTRKKTLELNNRNMKHISYSWLCHSNTAGKILQWAEWSFFIHISNSLEDGTHTAAPRWPPHKLRNSLAIFNLKLKWEQKKVAFTVLYTYPSMKAMVIYILLHLKHSFLDSFGEHDSQWVFWFSFSYLCQCHCYQKGFMSLIILKLTFIKPLDVFTCSLSEAAAKARLFLLPTKICFKT